MNDMLVRLVEKYGANATLREVLQSEQRAATGGYHRVLAGMLRRRDPNAAVVYARQFSADTANARSHTNAGQNRAQLKMRFRRI